MGCFDGGRESWGKIEKHRVRKVRGNEINMIQVKGGRCVRRNWRETLKIAGVIGSEKGSFQWHWCSYWETWATVYVLDGSFLYSFRQDMWLAVGHWQFHSGSALHLHIILITRCADHLNNLCPWHGCCHGRFITYKACLCPEFVVHFLPVGNLP